jgi:hypothetical protein
MADRARCCLAILKKSGEESGRSGRSDATSTKRIALGMLRRTLSFLFAGAVLLAGLALAGFELVRVEGVRPLMFLGALVMIIAGGA